VELLRVQVDDPVPPDMLVGLHVSLRPVGGEVEDARFTVPVKPFWADTVAVNEPVAPEVKLTLGGFAVRAKSCV
jgi:hypothetical protein